MNNLIGTPRYMNLLKTPMVEVVESAIYDATHVG
jgi:hypothetical protein